MEEIEPDYDHVIETLTNTFGNVFSREVFLAVIENCGGNLEQSANAVISIIMEGNDTDQIYRNASSEKSIQSAPNVSTSQDNIPTNSTVTYALASQTSKPTLKLVPKPTMPSTDISQNWTPQLRQILTHHENGARTLIIMRGAPGSGKSYLAKQLLNSMLGFMMENIYKIHILSTDDYFMISGSYSYQPKKILLAHEWNRKRATIAMRQGISPVVIDNTNILCSEMEGYVREGVKNGYIIEVVEPNTFWAKKPYELSKRNSHNVPIKTIRRMLENYENDITGDDLMQTFKCCYSHQMQPPILRNIPPIPQKRQEVSSSTENEKQCKAINTKSVKEKQATEIKMSPSTSLMDGNVNAERFPRPDIQAIGLKSQESNSLCDEETDSNPETINKNDKFTEYQKSLEEMEKVAIEWDNGESYINKNDMPSGSNSKPRRRNKSPRSLTTDKFIPLVEDCQDWIKMLELPPLGEKNSVPVDEKPSPILEKRSCSTFIEVGDFSTLNLNKSLKIITTTPRNINESYVELKPNKMPEKWLLDKSTSTSNNEILTNNHRCQYEELHFERFRIFFKNISRLVLRDIFDKCYGDVNWAVDIVLDGMENMQFSYIENDDTSDTEAESQNMEKCQCFSDYGVQQHFPVQSTSTVVNENATAVSSSPSYQLKKVKKETVVSEASKKLKRQIEENIVIPSSHLSQHSIKIRNLRRADETLKMTSTENLNPKNHEHLPVDNEVPSTSQHSQIECNIPSTSTLYDNNEISDDDSYTGLDDIESTVNVYVGKEFISQLDILFGRNMEYPENVKPKINMPMSLLNHLNALWMESLMYQLEKDTKQVELMIQQDEDIARAIAITEAELSQSGKEADVPDYKELMDMEFALSLYQKDIAECLNNKPLDMAGKLSREKLYKLFPDIQQSVLSELLVAHEGNFHATVEVLLTSTGQTNLIDGKNGVNKFLMNRESQRNQEKKTLSEEEWPLFQKWENLEMPVVEEYRKEGEKHLRARNIYYQKAQEFIKRGMPQLATNYSDIAAFHKRKYEYANSLAVAALMQIHALKYKNEAIIDLHYLRVSEARETLDLFLDTHIQKLKNVPVTVTVNRQILFIITGRGLHSTGGPKVKPAVMKRLFERDLVFKICNPGLLSAKVSAYDKLSYQLA